MSNRVTYKLLKHWVETYNKNWTVQVELSSHSDCYWIYEANGGNLICSAETPGKTWDLFCAWKAGYCKALELVRKGEVNPNA